jgi:hypothetical protein
MVDLPDPDTPMTITTAGLLRAERFIGPVCPGVTSLPPVLSRDR